MNVDNFDSGPGVEDVLREELARLLPRRYSVRAGTISDGRGMTAGDCDVVIFNDTWFPAIKAGATDASRKWHYPVEGVYGILEIKQSLTAQSLDAGMEKLVVTSRLDDGGPWPARLVENSAGVTTRYAQPRFTAIIATALGSDCNFDDLTHRFIALNGQVYRREVVNALCVLGHGYVTWGYDESGSSNVGRNSLYLPEEEGMTLHPLKVLTSKPDYGAFYALTSYMLNYLHMQVLAPGDIAFRYGAPQQAARPLTDQWSLPPDPPSGANASTAE